MRPALLVIIVLLAVPSAVAAQTDEIQVYDGGLTDVGVVNLTWHNNFVASGIKEPAFEGAVVANHSWNGVPEFAFGTTRWLELGLYLPVYSRDATTGWGIDGLKPRATFAVPGADERRFVYAVNFEFSINAKRWDEKRYTSEVRPIIGWHFGKVDFFFNPILDTSYDGLKNLEFAPATRLAFQVAQAMQLSVEEYDDFGPVHSFYSGSDQVHQLYGVVNRTIFAGIDLEAGVGVGLTDASDKLTFKVMFSRDLNPKHGGVVPKP
jgi:hypothetical protein